MKKFFSTLFFVCIGLICGKAQSYIFQPIWQVNDTYSYAVSTINTKMVNDSIKSSDTTTYIAHLQILSANEDGYRIQLSYEATDLFTELDSLIADKIPEDFKDIDVIYTTSPDGQYQGIENWEEISKQVRILLDSIMPAFLGDDAVLPKFTAGISQIYSSKEGIENNYSEIALIHFLYGSEMQEGYSYPYQEYLPNLFSPRDPFLANTIIEIDTVIPEQHLCTVKRYSAIDKKGMKKFMKTFAKLFSKEVVKEMKNTEMDIIDDYTFEYDTLYQLPSQISAKRYIDVTTDGEKVTKINEKKVQWLNE